jgi:DNA-binding IclR family transcriptional regulator
MPAGHPFDADVLGQVLEHIRRYPAGLSSYEIARALGMTQPRGWGQSRARRMCTHLAGQGLVRQETGPRGGRDSRPAVKWWPA